VFVLEAAHGVTELAQVTRDLAAASLDPSRSSGGQRRVEAPEKDVLTDGEGGERLDDWLRIAFDLFLLLLERRYNGEDRLVLCYLGDERGTRACLVKSGRAHVLHEFLIFARRSVEKCQNSGSFLSF